MDLLQQLANLTFFQGLEKSATEMLPVLKIMYRKDMRLCSVFERRIVHILTSYRWVLEGRDGSTIDVCISAQHCCPK
jgi:hypothetical protein